MYAVLSCGMHGLEGTLSRSCRTLSPATFTCEASPCTPPAGIKAVYAVVECCVARPTCQEPCCTLSTLVPRTSLAEACLSVEAEWTTDGCFVARLLCQRSNTSVLAWNFGIDHVQS